jgi:surface antigen
MKKTITITIAVSLLAGCANLEGIGTKQGIGTLGGAAAGGLAGAQVGKGSGKLAMTALGTLLGAVVGSEIGSSLDKADQLAMDRSMLAALDTKKIGKPVTWKNPKTGNRGTVTTTNETVTAEGYCREYQQTVTVGGKEEQAYGTACRQPDGSWKISA